MADWKSKPQVPSLFQTRQIGYVMIKTKNVIALNCTNPAFSACQNVNHYKPVIHNADIWSGVIITLWRDSEVVMKDRIILVLENS